jgi:DHA1 family multidrug resistance protein-like MFS transporter
MIEGMGVGPAGSLLGAVALALVPMPVLFYYYGAKLREKSTFAPTSVSPWISTKREMMLTLCVQILIRQPRQP